MKNILITLLLSLPVFCVAQVTQPASVQSQGASIEQTAGIYTNTVVVGEPISSGEISDPFFGGSSFGFLGSTGSNQAPVADAGMDQNVVSGDLVQLDGTASSDPDNNPLTYSWVSLDGVSLTDANSAQPTFTAPEVLAQKDFQFELTVSDGQEMDMDTVVVTVTSAQWIVTPLSNSATLVATVQLDGMDAVEGDLVAAFAGGTARGTDEVFISNGIPFISMLLQLETTESVSFEVYDVDQDRICLDNTVLTASPGQSIGNPSSPYAIQSVCGASCTQGNLTVLGDPIPADTYRATGRITTFGTVDPFTTVSFESETEIRLAQGFHAKANSTFTASIVSCSAVLTSSLESRNQVDGADSDLQLRIQPNPFSGITTVKYFLPEHSTQTRLQVVNNANQIVQTIALPSQAGWHTYAWEATDLPDGLYFVRLETAMGMEVLKVVVVK